VCAAESLTVLEKTGEEPATLRVTLPQRVPTSVWRGQQLGLAEVYRFGSVIASAPLFAEAAVSDPNAVSDVPAPRPVAAQPSGGAWERMKRSATRAAGMLSLRLLGTPLGPR
jgi:hypothetical protein